MHSGGLIEVFPMHFAFNLILLSLSLGMRLAVTVLLGTEKVHSRGLTYKGLFNTHDLVNHPSQYSNCG